MFSEEITPRPFEKKRLRCCNDAVVLTAKRESLVNMESLKQNFLTRNDFGIGRTFKTLKKANIQRYFTQIVINGLSNISCRGNNDMVFVCKNVCLFFEKIITKKNPLVALYVLKGKG